MPVVLEEEFENSLFFINELAVGAKIIIPHLGLLNGGYHAFVEHGVWDKQNVYADTALASPREIKDYIDNFGHGRILFGSDFPFGYPKEELSKVLNISIPRQKKEMILGLNLKRLLATATDKQ
jgi:predicted TIM-barrel fold metal-dependent hydrolase